MVPKFRAWNMPFGPNGPMQEMVYGKASSILAFAEMSPDKYIVEQSADLKDANGKEIYEGDIVRMRRSGFHEHACYEVKYFVQDVCIFKKVKVTDGSTLFESPSNGHDVEIIGNVHTNAELLKE
ncbi:hypothetical protein ABB39_01115 [Levilactobacillus brevis]|nr:hypothetical protein ABB39_01115 [Levilactobacillus brevis]ORJ54189.1 hypothetical protein LBR_09710 [Levilactobacillus brevis]